MQLDIATEAVVTFLLVSTRILATLLVAPPFNGGMVPVRIRVALAVTIGILLASGVGPDTAPPPLDVPSLVLAIATQVLAGLVFGFFVLLLFSAFQVAGSIIDLSTGLSAGTLYDPVTQSNVAPIGRLYQLVSLALLLTVNGHLLIVRGVIRSYEAAPAGAVDTAAFGQMLTRGAGQLLVAALEIGFPVLAALLLTEVALGIASRAAPRMNIMMVGFGVKSLVLFLVLGLGLPLLVNATVNLLDDALRMGSSLIES
ncbi:MAG: flagellar biosynthetic protein FliR [Acidimicrobiales bacterium]